MYFCGALLFAFGLSACASQEPVEPFKGRREWGPRRPDVIFVPTPAGVIARMLQMAEVKSSDTVYDLGCGDGRIVIAAARDFGARGMGYDIDPQRIAEARENARRARVEQRVQFHEADIFTVDLSGATVVALYLLPSMNRRLMPQLAALPPGVRIVSHDFPMGAAIPEQTEKLFDAETGRAHYIFLWRTPWRLDPEMDQR